MFEKLQADYQRFLELEAALRRPGGHGRPARLTALAKERGTLAKVAIPYGRYLELGRQIAEAEALREAEADSEMRSYAEAELEALRARQTEVGEALRDLIYDQQAGADHAGLIVEIRAGTGGDEAALFVRDLLRDVPPLRRPDGLDVRAAGDGPDRARRVPRGLVRHQGRGGVPPPPVRERRPPRPARAR